MFHSKNRTCVGASLVAQWLRHHTPSTGGMGLIPGWGTKISQAAHDEFFFFFNGTFEPL